MCYHNPDFDACVDLFYAELKELILAARGLTNPPSFTSADITKMFITDIEPAKKQWKSSTLEIQQVCPIPLLPYLHFLKILNSTRNDAKRGSVLNCKLVTMN